MWSRSRVNVSAASAALCLLFAQSVQAQTLSGDALVNALRQGGYIIVMRHASSPREAPDKQHANPDNVNAERQLDQEGRDTAAAMGNAIRRLQIPIGEVYSSPTYRALETVRYAKLGKPERGVGYAHVTPELGDNGQSMQGGTAQQAAWLREQVLQFPKGTNTVIITHLPNLTGAFPQLAAGMADGEAMIFGAGTGGGPDGKGGAAMVARVKIEAWPAMQ